MIFNLFCEHPLLRRIQRDVGFTYVKFNGILSDEMHLYSEDTAGKVLLSFAYVDKALDFLLSVSLRPFIQLGFMPEALSKENVHRFRYSISAPASYDKWCVMIDQLIAEKIVSRRSGSAFDHWVAMGAMELTTQEEFENLACRSVPAISRYKAATQDGKLPIEALLDMLEVRLVTVEPLS